MTVFYLCGLNFVISLLVEDVENLTERDKSLATLKYLHIVVIFNKNKE